MTIPNILSISRIFMIPLFIYIFFFGKIDNNIAAVVVLIISGITDVSDGYIARKFNQTSDIGKVLDPLADKLTILSVLTCLYIKHMIHPFILIFFYCKEILQIILAAFMWKKKIVVQSNIWGKVTTCMIYAGIFLIIMMPKLCFGNLILIITTVLAFVAFVQYFVKNKRKYDRQKTK